MSGKQLTYQSILLPDGEGNNIEAELFPGYLELTAEWAGDIYGEGGLTLSTPQARILLAFLKEHLED